MAKGRVHHTITYEGVSLQLYPDLSWITLQIRRHLKPLLSLLRHFLQMGLSNFPYSLEGMAAPLPCTLMLTSLCFSLLCRQVHQSWLPPDMSSCWGGGWSWETGFRLFHSSLLLLAIFFIFHKLHTGCSTALVHSRLRFFFFLLQLVFCLFCRTPSAYSFGVFYS